MESTFVGLLTIVVGGILCFGGFRFLRFLLFIVGFAVGFTLGGIGIALITGKGFLGDVYGWIAAIVVGFVIAGLIFAFFVAGVALLGGILGYGLGLGAMVGLGYDTGAVLTQGVGIAAAAVLIGLTFVLNVPRFLVIIYTATTGAAAIVAGVLVLLGRAALDKQQALDAPAFVHGQPIWLLPWAVLAIAGIGAQWRSLPKRVTTPTTAPAAQPAPVPAQTPAAEPGPGTGAEPSPHAEPLSEAQPSRPPDAHDLPVSPPPPGGPQPPQPPEPRPPEPPR